MDQQESHHANLLLRVKMVNTIQGPIFAKFVHKTALLALVQQESALHALQVLP